jgi:hypothetical protein
MSKTIMAILWMLLFMLMEAISLTLPKHKNKFWLEAIQFQQVGLATILTAKL